MRGSALLMLLVGVYGLVLTLRDFAVDAARWWARRGADKDDRIT